MTGRAFSILLIFALVAGVLLGGAFAAGFALGRGQESDSAQGITAQRPLSGFGGGPEARGSRGEGQPSALGNAASEEGRRQPSEENVGRGTGTPNEQQATQRGNTPETASERQEAFGTIAGFENGLLVVDSPRGQVTGAVTETTVVLKIMTATAQDLVPGVRVVISGRAGEDGQVQARSIMVTPEAAGSVENLPLGSGQRRGGGFQASGSIAAIGEGMVTVATAEGDIQAAFGEGTLIQRLEPASPADLIEGEQVRVSGILDSEEVLQAEAVILSPEGQERPSRRGSRGGEPGAGSP